MTRLITENWGWKLTSLALAYLLWLAVANNPVYMTTISAPVQYRNIPSYLEMSTDVVDGVRLEVRGPSNRLTSGQMNDAAVILDLARVSRPGEQTFPVEQSNAVLPPDVTLLRAMPAQVRLIFERRLTREVPVHLRIGKGPPEQYEIEKQELDPPVMRVVGPESRVQEIHTVDTDPVDLGSVVSEAEFQVYSYLPDAQVRFERNQRILVRISVRRKPT